MHRYRAFGLNLESEIPLNELMPSDFEDADVSIRLGMVAPFSNAGQARRTQVTRDTFQLDKACVARFRAEKGNLVTVQPCPGSSPEEIKLYLLGSCMGAILLQKGICPMHGSCMSVMGKGVLLTGSSGAGKSTIAAALLAGGLKILTDDVAAVRFDGAGIPVVSPSYPGQKLWEDAAERAEGVCAKTPLFRTKGSLGKFSVRRDDFFCPESVPLTAVYEIVPLKVSDVALEEIRGAAKMDILLENIYRKRMAYRMGLAGWCCLTSMNIAKSVKVYRIVRPSGAHLENRIVQRILEEQNSNPIVVEVPHHA